MKSGINSDIIFTVFSPSIASNKLFNAEPINGIIIGAAINAPPISADVGIKSNILDINPFFLSGSFFLLSSLLIILIGDT